MSNLRMPHSDRGRFLYLRGMCAAAKSQYDRAIRDFNDSILADPSRADTFVQRALAFRAQEKWVYALVDLAKAKSLTTCADEHTRIHEIMEQGQFHSARREEV